VKALFIEAREGIDNESLLMLSLKERIIYDSQDNAFYTGFSKQRIPRFQLMIHLLKEFKEFFTKENIKKLLETDDSTWDVKRIRTADYPPKLVDDKNKEIPKRQTNQQIIDTLNK